LISLEKKIEKTVDLLNSSSYNIYIE